jgi:plasmid maintenance system antidote protein VapI
MNYNKLRGRIVEIYGSQKRFASDICLSEQSVTAKLNGRSDFSQEDILRWSNSLNISKEEIGKFFFEK